MADEPTQADEVVMLDLEEVRALFTLLTEFKAASFQGFGMTIVFKDEEAPFVGSSTAPQAQVVDDGHSTSNKPVDGFKPKLADGFRHKALYPWQNGKVLKLNGSLE